MLFLFTLVASNMMPCLAFRRTTLFAGNGIAFRSALGVDPWRRQSPCGSGPVSRLHPRRSVTRTMLLSSTSSSSSLTPTSADVAPPLPYDDHTHNSVKVTIPAIAPPDPDADNDDDPYRDPAAFRSSLRATISAAKSLGKSALWMTVPMSRGHLLGPASEAGLAYHHAAGDVATLCVWLKSDIGSLIPEYATHQVGVGAVVIRSKSNDDDDDELLVVREARNNYRPWKIPGGLAELGEQLDEAAIREVLEETGIPCRFVGVLGVRHTHGMQFGRSDLYFVCRMEPVPDEDGTMPEPTPQAGEIEAVTWLPLSEFRSMVTSEDKNVGHPMMATIMKVVDQSSGMERMIIPSIVPKRKPSPLYHVPIRPDDGSPS